MSGFELETPAVSARTQPAESVGDSFDLFMADIEKIPLLTPEQEVELGERIQAGDEEARQKMIVANLRLVVSIARSFTVLSLPHKDLVQGGVFGLIDAAEKFDPSRGLRFSSFATPVIRNEIIKEIADTADLIKKPYTERRRLAAIVSHTRFLEAELQRKPTPEEVADMAGLAVEAVIDLQAMPNTTVSLSTPTGDAEGETTLEDTLVGETDVNNQLVEAAQRENNEEAIEDALAVLTSEELQVLMARYSHDGDKPPSFRVVGEELDMTISKVSTTEERALTKLRHHPRLAEKINI